MPFEPDKISADHIRKAVHQIQVEGIELKPSTRYDVIIDGQAWPPKEIMRYAHEQMNGEKRWTRSGGEPTNRYFERLGFEIINKTTMYVQHALIEKYKSIIKEDGNKKELYKWQLIKKFQEQWDIEAADFAEMVQSIEYGNLLDYRSKTLIYFAHEYAEEARGLFRMLYDENIDLEERIRKFGEQAEQLVKRNHPDKGAFQDERSIATYLTFRYPDTYTIYKYSFYADFIERIGEPKQPPGLRYLHYLRLVDDFITNYISQDDELVSLSRATLDEDCFADQNLKILAQDILFRTLDKSDESSEAFVRVLEAIGYENSSAYFGLLVRLVADLGLEQDDARAHFGVRSEHNRLSFTTGQRYCLSASAKASEPFGFISPERDSSSNSTDSFSGEPEAYWHVTDQPATVEKAYDNIRASVLEEMKRTRKSGFRTFTNSSFEQAVFDADFRNEVFMETFGQKTTVVSQPKNRSAIEGLPLNQILFGPPGTGKTYQTVNKALQIVDPDFYEAHQSDREALTERYRQLLFTDWDAAGEKRIAFTTFHQSFTYEDFVEGIKPDVKEGQLQYKIEDGIFKRICRKARAEREVSSSSGGEHFVLIIDEINRGNIAQIFGELITLIEPDKREGGEEELRAILPYSKMPFRVPSNLHIIGTMNTADRSIEALDTALRRRFSFDGVPPKPGIIKTEGALRETEGIVQVGEDDFDLVTLLNTINMRIEKLLDKDHLIGHSYFMRIHSAAALRLAFERNIIPLLEEYFYGDKGKIQLVLGRGFVERSPAGDDGRLFAVSDYDDSIYQDREVWRITSDWKAQGRAFADALHALLGN